MTMNDKKDNNNDDGFTQVTLSNKGDKKKSRGDPMVGKLKENGKVTPKESTKNKETEDEDEDDPEDLDLNQEEDQQQALESHETQEGVEGPYDDEATDFTKDKDFDDDL